ncbi:hypothetical protein LTR81_027805, partial [Elasticomyces elasticus]
MKGYTAALLLHMLLRSPTLALADIPTFTAQGSDTYLGAPSPGLTVDSNDVHIDDSNGLDVTFGTDWSKKIRDTVDANCVDGQSDQCKQQLQQTLGLGSTPKGLNPRMIGVLVVLGGIALSYIIAEIIRLSLDDAKKYEVVHIQLPKAQTDELSSWNVTEGRFNFDPVNGDPFEVEMNFNPGSKPPSNSDSPLSAAKQDNGDIVLTAGSLAAVIDEQFSQALCSRGLGSRALVKRLSLQCMVNRLERLRRAVQEGGAAFAIQYVDPFDFPPPVDDLYQTLFKETSDFADH